MTAGTDERIDIEDPGHSTAPVTMIQSCFVTGRTVEHMKIDFEKGLGDRLGSKTGS